MNVWISDFPQGHKLPGLQNLRALCSPGRHMVDNHEDARHLGQYYDFELGWPHRSIYDFIMENEHGPVLGLGDTKSAVYIVHSLLLGDFYLLLYDPARNDDDEDEADEQVYDAGKYHPNLPTSSEKVIRFMKAIGSASHLIKARGDSWLDTLRSGMSSFSLRELGLKKFDNYIYVPTQLKTTGLLFWRYCVRFGFLEYISSRGKVLTPSTDSHWLFAMLVHDRCERYRRFPEFAQTWLDDQDHSFVSLMLQSFRVSSMPSRRRLSPQILLHDTILCSHQYLSWSHADITWRSRTGISAEHSIVTSLTTIWCFCLYDMRMSKR